MKCRSQMQKSVDMLNVCNIFPLSIFQEPLRMPNEDAQLFL